MTDHATPRQRGIIDQMRDLGEEPTFTVALPAPTTGPDDIGAESWGRPIRARRPNQEPPMTEWTLNLTYRKPPLTLNQRGCWAKHDPHRKALRHQAAQLAQAARIPKNLTHITTRLHYRAPDRIRRDEDNLIATAKPLWDGLVDAGTGHCQQVSYPTAYNHPWPSVECEAQNAHTPPLGDHTRTKSRPRDNQTPKRRHCV